MFSELKHPGRFKNVDLLRSFAILAVLLRHSEIRCFYYGGYGVDLFLVISGFLVSNPLIQALTTHRPISPSRFITRRAIRILPSYLVFILLGCLISHALYHQTHPESVLPFNQLYRYLLFILNYMQLPIFIFNHTWSLCVEEHFYLLLPLGFLIVRWRGPDALLKYLLSAIAFILTLKVVLYLYNGHYPSSATHGRLDALLMGVTARYLYETKNLGRAQGHVGMATLGFLMLMTVLFIDWQFPGGFYEKVCVHFLVPLSVTAVLIGTLGWTLKGIFPLQLVAYYSYNLYLWHLLFRPLIFDRFGHGALAVSIYIAIAFVLGVLFKHLVEDPFLGLKDFLFRKASPIPVFLPSEPV